jgi:hypothetical protein
LPEFPSASQVEYHDDPIHGVRLSESWSQAGKAYRSTRRHAQSDAELRAAARVAARLAERRPEYRPPHEDSLRRPKRFLDTHQDDSSSRVRAKA